MLLIVMCVFLYTAGLYDFSFLQSEFQIQKLNNQKTTSGTQTQDEKIARQAIEKEYSQFKNFEKQKTMFGRKITVLTDRGNRYVAYINYGDTMYVGTATCFQVDIMGKVTQIGIFPSSQEAYSNFMNVYPKTCEGLK